MGEVHLDCNDVWMRDSENYLYVFFQIEKDM